MNFKAKKLTCYIHTSEDTHLEAAEFCKPFHAADTGITRVCFLVHVVHHLVAMVWPEGYGRVYFLLYQQYFFHYGIHIRVAV